MPLFHHFFLLKSAGSLGWYAFSSCCLSLKVKVPSKNADWKDKLLYFRLPKGSDIRGNWNLGKLSNRLDDSLAVQDFDVLEGTDRRKVLLSTFSELTLVWAGLRHAHLDISSDDYSSSSGGPSDSRSESLGIVSSVFVFVSVWHSSC